MSLLGWGPEYDGYRDLTPIARDYLEKELILAKGRVAFLESHILNMCYYIKSCPDDYSAIVDSLLILEKDIERYHGK